ncbi:DUF4254 domain-containing protein [Actinoallomurus iriomotensis]|uniref:DUF4254 domain-containing protein n=1 Tax=Actinoallomurus iriomotensis TaxID=478107 RepID=UPI003D7F38C6
MAAENLTHAAADTPLHTETVGSVIDRLSIAAIRVEVLRRRRQPPTASTFSAAPVSSSETTPG